MGNNLQPQLQFIFPQNFEVHSNLGLKIQTHIPVYLFSSADSVCVCVYLSESRYHFIHSIGILEDVSMYLVALITNIYYMGKIFFILNDMLYVEVSFSLKNLCAYFIQDKIFLISYFFLIFSHQTSCGWIIFKYTPKVFLIFPNFVQTCFLNFTYQFLLQLNLEELLGFAFMVISTKVIDVESVLFSTVHFTLKYQFIELSNQKFTV